MSTAQFGASIGVGFVLVVSIPRCAVPVVDEPVVVSVFRKFVCVEPGGAGDGVLI